MTQKNAETIRRMWTDGATLDEIAQATGLNPHTVGSWAQNHRDQCPARRRRVSGWQKQEIRRLREQGLSVRHVAYRLGLSKRTVESWSKGVRVPKAERHARLELLWAMGRPVKDIAKLTGLTVHAVCAYASAHRDTCPKRHRTDVQAARRQVLRMREEGKTVREIAELLGCSRNNIYETYLKKTDVDIGVNIDTDTEKKEQEK